MILSEARARMHCEYEKCEAALTVDLVLNVTGTWAVKAPNGHGWQVFVSEQGVFLTRCPNHHSQIATLANPGLEIARMNGRKRG